VDDQVSQSERRANHQAGRQTGSNFATRGLSFVAPQKVEYRYQLEGFDRGWIEAGTPPGSLLYQPPSGQLPLPGAGGQQ